MKQLNQMHMVTKHVQDYLPILKIRLVNLRIYLQPRSGYSEGHSLNDCLDAEEKNILLLADHSGNYPALVDLKNAFHTWYGFENEERSCLLKAFDAEIEKLRPGLNCNEKTMVFCRLFLHEFVSALTTMTK